MGSPHHRPLTAGDHTLHLPLLLLTLLITARCSYAQSPPNANNNTGPPYFKNANFNPSMAIVILVLISAFFFLGFFSIYIRQCAGDRSIHGRSLRGAAATAAGTTGRSRRQRGLDPDSIASLPTLVYSDVKAHKIGKSSLECAVCLSEFEDDETLRLLPRCDHVFHPDCIDAWLSTHVTCPVCRSNLTDPPPAGPTDPPPPPPIVEQVEEPPQVEHLVVEVEDGQNHNQQDEIEDLERFINMKRTRSTSRGTRFPRSHSTGHSLVLPGENLDRFTLRLPENIRKEIVLQAERLQRTKSLVVFSREESSKRGYRGGRSVKLGRSDRWGSLLLRTLSTKMPNWGRRGGGGGDAEGSTSTRGGGFFRRGDSMKGEGSTRRFNAVIAPFDCYGGGGAKSEGLVARDDESQSSTAALNRV